MRPAHSNLEPYRTLDPATLPGFTLLEGLPGSSGPVLATHLSEDSDLIVLGHLDEELAWRALVAYRADYDGIGIEETDRVRYEISHSAATFTTHHDDCEAISCTSFEDDVCEACRADQHDECSDESGCECATGWEHEVAGEWPCGCECECGEYGWWANGARIGYPVTWIRWAYETAAV